MAFNFKVDSSQNNASEIESIKSISESFNQKSQTIKTQTIKTQNFESDDIKTELSFGEYSETFESDDESDNSKHSIVASRQKSSRKSIKSANKYHSINESDENEYSDTFEELSSTSSSKSKSYQDSSRKSSKPFTTTKSYKYTDTFCTEYSSPSSEYESISLKTGKKLSIRELTKRVRHKLKYKNAQKNDEFNAESIKKLTEKLKETLNKPKTDQTEKINRNYDEYSNIKINEKLMKHLNLEKYIQDTKCDYDDKIKNFGNDLVYDCFPEQQHEHFDFKKMRKELYFKNKCDLVKFKIISEKIDSHEIYFVDSLTLIGNLASELPKPSTNPNEIWKKLLEPLNNQANKKNLI